MDQADAAPQRGSLDDVVARLERLPLASAVRRLVIVLALGCFFENYFLLMTAYVAPGMVKSGIFVAKASSFFDLHSVGFFILSGFTGMMVGSSIFGFFADRFGRRPIFVWAMLWYSVTTAIMALQSEAIACDLWRFVSSIGLGLELVVVNSYVTELASSRVRGRAVALYQFTALLSVPLVAFASMILTPLSLFGVDGWRWVMFAGSAGVIIVWWLRRRLPESPRWLATMGRAAEADAVLCDIERTMERELGQPLPTPVAVSRSTAKAPAAAVTAAVGSFAELFRVPYRRRTLMFIIQQLFMPIAFYGFQAWVPTLLIAKGVAVTESLFYAFLIAFATPASPLVMSLFADRFDRKAQIAFGAVASALFIAAFTLLSSPALVVTFGLLVTFCKSIITTAIANYMPECYPTRIRGRGHGLVYGVSRVMAAFSGLLIAYALGFGGIEAVGLVIFVSFTVVALITLALGPSVKGRTLEEISP